MLDITNYYLQINIYIYKIKNEHRLNCKGIGELPEIGLQKSEHCSVSFVAEIHMWTGGFTASGDGSAGGESGQLVVERMADSEMQWEGRLGKKEIRERSEILGQTTTLPVEDAEGEVGPRDEGGINEAVGGDSESGDGGGFADLMEAYG